RVRNWTGVQTCALPILAGNRLAMAGAAAGGGALLKSGLDKGRSQLTNSLVNAGKSRLGVGKASADSKSPAAGEELLGDAENPTQIGRASCGGRAERVGR